MRGDAINNTRDFLDVLVMMEKTGQFSSAIKDIDTTIKALALTQLVAGVDSMANTMVWVLALLLDNPEMLAKAQIELDTNVGKDRLVEESRYPKFEVFASPLKRDPPNVPKVGPLLVPHEAMEDCHVAGYFVPRGTGLFINAWTIQRDPNVWAEPDRFLPERFLTTNADMDVKGQSYELLPFGSQDDRARRGTGPTTNTHDQEVFSFHRDHSPCDDFEELWCLRRKVRKITKSSSFNGNKKYAPEPPGAWPIIGHLPLLVSAKQPHRAFAALADKYGPAFMLRMGMTSPMLIVVQ
ncbi:hypothetical protein Syun_031459 [Stephania yunnanensis]|uniref:Cytochrome P450 n=1 Tax=Stephania yunnanensis TaxID=152371 RepID=A0AAP0DVV1_9MAGN